MAIQIHTTHIVGIAAFSPTGWTPKRDLGWQWGIALLNRFPPRPAPSAPGLLVVSTVWSDNRTENHQLHNASEVIKRPNGVPKGPQGQAALQPPPHARHGSRNLSDWSGLGQSRILEQLHSTYIPSSLRVHGGTSSFAVCLKSGFQ